MKRNVSFGRAGEEAAAEWYRGQGFRILDQNWRAPREYGGNEIDIVAAGHELVVFCEVKARATDHFGSSFEAVDWRKQARIRRAAQAWLQQAKHYYPQVRFDVVAVDGRKNVRVIKGAFQ